MSIMNSDIETQAKCDMEQFIKEDPMPKDIESAEFYAWNRRRVERARALIDCAGHTVEQTT